MPCTGLGIGATPMRHETPVYSAFFDVLAMLSQILELTPSAPNTTYARQGGVDPSINMHSTKPSFSWTVTASICFPKKGGIPSFRAASYNTFCNFHY
eukprot:9245125-Ditylum_brightwellii.AAC.1